MSDLWMYLLGVATLPAIALAFAVFVVVPMGYRGRYINEKRGRPWMTFGYDWDCQHAVPWWSPEWFYRLFLMPRVMERCPDCRVSWNKRGSSK